MVLTLVPEAARHMKSIIQLLGVLHAVAWAIPLPFLPSVLNDWVNRTKMHDGYIGIFVIAMMYGACMTVLLFVSLIAYISADGKESMSKHKGAMRVLAIFSVISIIYLIFIFSILFTMKGT